MEGIRSKLEKVEVQLLFTEDAVLVVDKEGNLLTFGGPVQLGL